MHCYKLYSQAVKIYAYLYVSSERERENKHIIT